MSVLKRKNNEVWETVSDHSLPIRLLQSGTPESDDYVVYDPGTGAKKCLASQLKTNKIISISLPTASWTGSGPYTQVITITGSTANTKVDLDPSSSVLTQMLDDGTTALFIDNDGGILTAYALSEKPSVDLTVQATISEVGV